MAKIKCSELAKLVYNLARMEAASPDVKSLDDVVAKMRERLPELDRQRVVDSIIEATTGQASTRTELQQKLGELKSEARKDKKLRDEVKNLQDTLAGKVKRTKKKSAPKPTPAAIAELKAERDALKSQVEAMESPEGLQKLARDYAKQFVAAGITDREALLTAVHNELAETFPELSRRDAMDAISGYANYSELSKDEIDVQLRDLKGQYQQLAKLEDMAAGQAPKKTGQERRAPSDSERELIQQVNEAKKAGGYNVTDPAKQLKTSLDAIKTRLKNQIADLERQIKTGEPIIRERKPSPTDAEVEALRKRRDELAAEWKKLAHYGLSDAQRVEVAKRVTQRSIEELERRLQERDFSRRAHRETPVTPELAELRRQRDELRNQYDKENPNRPNLLAMRERLARLSWYLEAGQLPPPGKPRTQDESPEATQLREALGNVQEALKNSTPAIRQKYQDQIDRYEKRLAENDFAPPINRKEFLDTPELEKMQYERDRLRKRIQQKIRDLKPRSLTDRIADPLNAARAVMTSLDLSAVLRQGGTVVISNPGLALKNFVPMLRAFASPQYTHKVEQEILNRPNAPLYARAKLFLPIDDASSLSQREEAYMTTLLDKIAEKLPPRLAKIDPITGSANAYKIFLAKMRADLFDQMVDSLAINGEATLDEAKIISNFINVATGRGTLGKFEQSATLLNIMFFAPKYVVSRFQFLLGQPAWGGGQGSWRVRRAIYKEYGKYAMGLGTLLGLAALYLNNDDDEDTGVSFDPQSADFAKIKIGNTRLDFTSGLSQTSVFLSRTGKAIADATKDALGYEVEPPKFGQSYYDQFTRFARYKAAPLPGAIINIASRQDPLGRATSADNELTNLVTPLAARELVKVLEDQGFTRGTAISLLALLGAGVNTYEERGTDDNTSETTTEEATAAP